MTINVVDTTGKDTGRSVELPDSLFAVEPNDHAIYLDVKQFLNSKRQGTHKARERGEIKGSTKKIRRQKGTGGARFGDIKNPIFKGGGRAFGPRVRDYGFKLNKKLKKLARASALTYKAKDEAVTVVEDIRLDAPKTKEFAGIMDALGGGKTLYVMSDADRNVVLSARNIQTAGLTSAGSLNTYTVLNADRLIVAESAVEHLKNLAS